MSSENLNPGAFSHATDLKNRIFFTIFLLIIYRLGTYVPSLQIISKKIVNNILFFKSVA